MKKLFFGALVACAAATFVGCGNSFPLYWLRVVAMADVSKPTRN